MPARLSGRPSILPGSRSSFIAGPLVIPPGSIREGPHIDLEGPGRSMLLSQVKVCLGDLLGKHQAIVFHAADFSQLLEPLRAQHFAQRVRCVDGSIDQDVRNVDPLRGKLCIEGLAKHSTAPHRGRVRVLSGVAPYGRRCGGDENRSFAAFFHVRTHG